jgi:hypothetical protein
MNNALKTFSLQGQRTPDMTIDWEAQPSMQHLVRRADEDSQYAPTWAVTMPVSFEAMQEPATFCEPLTGLAMRDLDEPEIFRAFFGDTRAAAARA